MITRLLVACPVDTFLTNQGAQASVFRWNRESMSWPLNGSDCVRDKSQIESWRLEVERFFGDPTMYVRGLREAKKPKITGANAAIDVVNHDAKGRSFCA
ncbi:MAG: hypothetical protein ACK50Q_14170 [Labrys sp. (in: a-proteobacteria)]